ncbi:MAG: glycosyltransferase [Bacteroidales bacterium]|nr:glycosyltransferase [Bacteroidales bacterium]
MIPELIFWIVVFLVLHTYVLYPLILRVFSAGRKGNSLVYERNEELPVVSVIISAHNEEACIKEKVQSIFAGFYPSEKFEVLIGSDHSTDKTGDIIRLLMKDYPTLKFFDFKERRGKGSVVNDLVQKASGTILVLTDANVIFNGDTLFYLVRHFKNSMIGLVDTNMVNRGMKEEGISYQEKAYISREVWIKDHESRLWGAMMGPFGGCYAIRKEDYARVPANFLVDDFYINMRIFEKGKLAINDIRAIVFERVPDELKVEFHRKVRIGTGNFQNLRKFWRLIFTSRYGFAFLSHKVIRWFSPFFLLTALATNIFLAFGSRFYLWILFCHLSIYFIPLIDWALKKLNIYIGPFRLATHFLSMNTALFIGFFRSLGKVRSGVWERTERG